MSAASLPSLSNVTNRLNWLRVTRRPGELAHRPKREEGHHKLHRLDQSIFLSVRPSEPATIRVVPIALRQGRRGRPERHGATGSDLGRVDGDRAESSSSTR